MFLNKLSASFLAIAATIPTAACDDDSSTSTNSPEASLTLQTDATILTMMNTWTPQNGSTVAEVAAAVADGIAADIRTVDGFLGGAVLESLDGTNVVVYGSWRDMAAVEAVQSVPTPTFDKAFEIATAVPTPYRIDEVAGELILAEAVGNPGELTMVNTWTPIGAAPVDEVATALSDGITTDTARQPGFRAAAVFASLDGTNVRALGIWDNQEALEAYGTVIQEGGAPVFAKMFGLAESNAIPYRVAAVITP